MKLDRFDYLETDAVGDVQTRWIDRLVVSCKVVASLNKRALCKVHANSKVHTWHHFGVSGCIAIVDTDRIQTNAVAAEPVITGGTLVVSRDLAKRHWDHPHIATLDQTDAERADFIALSDTLNGCFVLKVEDVLAGTVANNGLVRIVGTKFQR